MCSSDLKGIRADKAKMADYLERSLMLVTALSPIIGYEEAARAALLAHREGLSLKQACLQLGLLDEARLDELLRPEKMV